MNSRTFCAAPWAHIFVGGNGKLGPCCAWNTNQLSGSYTQIMKFYNGEEMRNLRKQLHHGEQVPACNICWQEEAHGKLSMRQIYSRDLSRKVNLRSLDTETWQADVPVSYYLELGNLCNLQCVMCDSEHSTSIGAEYQQHQQEFSQLKFYAKPTVKGEFTWPRELGFKQFIDEYSDKIQILRLAGGEPTLIPYVHDLFDSIPHPENVDLEITTNATKITDRFLEQASKFKSVRIIASVEGVGTDNDQIRYGSNWTEFQQNLRKLKELPNSYIVLNYVFQCFSIKTFLPLLAWADSNNFTLDVWSVQDLDYLDIHSVEPQQIDEFVDMLEKTTSEYNQLALDTVLNKIAHYQYNPLQHVQMLEYLKTLDSIRGTQLTSYFL